MELFNNDTARVKKLDDLVAFKLGFGKSVPVSGQTITRKFDVRILGVLSSIAQSAYRAANDIRILQHSSEIEEPFERNQVGSSAMPYKRNPILAERMTALARFLINDFLNAAYTFSGQFLERTLDDSANRRLSMSQGFLSADSILIIYQRLIEGLTIYPEVIKTLLKKNLPFFATEKILMKSVKCGGDRQENHEIIRRAAMKAVEAIRNGSDYDIISELKESGRFKLEEGDWEDLSDFKNYTGRAEEQVEEFIEEYVEPMLKNNKAYIGIKSEIRV
jgi:adenylosuccinate lyase